LPPVVAGPEAVRYRDAIVLGERLAGRYEVLREIGRGGMGVVYLARDPLLEREVALKVIAAGALDAESRERLLREARVVARLDHPSIMSLYDIGEDDGRLFLVMPFVPGTTLRPLIVEGELRLTDVVDIGIQAAGALEHSHRAGVLHRDVKPENIMVDRWGGALRIRVMDFGLASVASGARLTHSGVIVGTGAYLSPERLTGGVADERADLYALGTVLYECVAGRLPFDGDAYALLYQIVHETPRPLRALARVDDALEQIVMRCLAKAPERRPQHARELRDALTGCRARVADSGEAVALLSTLPRRAAPRPPPGRAGPFVGRQQELAELGRRLDAALGGEAHLCLVAGESGSGKSRLLEELAAMALLRGACVLDGCFAELDEALPLQGFQTS
jgi:serine/threonine protein kinase